MNPNNHIEDNEDFKNPFSFLSGEKASEQKKEGERFDVPEGYFDALENEIACSIITDKLQISKAEPYRVPVDYFEWLPTIIQERITEQKKAAFTFERLKALLVPKFWIPGLAVVVIMLTICIRVMDPGQAAALSAYAAETALNEGDKKEVIENLELYGIEESEIQDHIAVSAKAADIADISADKKAVIDYLIENEADLNTISTE